MRYFAGFLVLLAIFLFGIVIFGSDPGENSEKPATPISKNTKSLPDYASTDAIARLTIDGPINGDDMHRQIRISVSSTLRTIDIIQGYQGTVIQTESFINNQAAYTAFLHALNKAGYTGKLVKTKKIPFVSDDDQGACPLGNRYYYEIINSGNNADQRLWTSSCGAPVPGNFGGSAPLVNQLFQTQFVNYGEFTKTVGI